jgi:hypothetical protein
VVTVRWNFQRARTPVDRSLKLLRRRPWMSLPAGRPGCDVIVMPAVSFYYTNQSKYCGPLQLREATAIIIPILVW